MQLCAIEFARNVIGISDANSTEFNPNTKNPIIQQIVQNETSKMMRLGLQSIEIAINTKTIEVYNCLETKERHRNSYEFNSKYTHEFEQHGMIVGAHNKETNSIEALEIKEHPFFIAVQFHPEYISRPLRPHPLFLGFVKATKQQIFKGNK